MNPETERKEPVIDELDERPVTETLESETSTLPTKSYAVLEQLDQVPDRDLPPADMSWSSWEQLR